MATMEIRSVSKNYGTIRVLDDINLQIGDGENCNRLIMTLQTQHMSEEGVAESLYRLLVYHGIITPDGQPAQGGPPAAAPAPADSGSKLWTPGSPTAPAAASQAGSEQPAAEKSKLWVPGMD